MSDKTIERITEMEEYFDILSHTVKDNNFIHNELTDNMLRKLTDYYEGGKWLADYESDERGELPSDLKRGVLSQDGLYNLLTDIKQIK